MPKTLKFILIGIVVIVVGGTGYFMFVNKSTTITHKIMLPNGALNWKNDAENTVLVFFENVNTPGYSDNINIAFGKLTSNAQEIVKEHSPSSTLNSLALGLAYFIGVQEGPDGGMSVISSKKLNDGKVEVLTKWNYSGAPKGYIEKTFILIFENDEWKINKVVE